MGLNQNEINTEAKRLIDEALADYANVNFVESGDITNLLLDLRLLFIEEVANNENTDTTEL